MKQFCRQGHDTFQCGRYSDGKCCRCVRERNRIWAKRNFEKMRGFRRKWSRENPSKDKAAKRDSKRKRRGATNVPTEPVTPYPCDLCGKMTKRLNCDHDHETGAFRGWLCYHCNIALGTLGDTAAGLLKALDYVRRANKNVDTSPAK